MIENLGTPFLIADEMVFHMPKGGRITITQSQFKLLFVLDGEIEHELDSSDGPKVLRPGDILVCPGFKWHRYINPSGRTGREIHLMRLFLNSDHIVQQTKRRNKQPETNLTDFVGHYFTETIQLPGGIDSQIKELLNSLRRETERREIGARHNARSICTELIVAVQRRIYAAHQSQANLGRKQSDFMVATAKEYILKNLDSNLTLGEIAWQARKGEEHLARVFKRETGQSVFDFVREMRVNQAKTYLLSSSMSLTEIATRTGFASLAFFSRTFKSLVGVPPSAYRQYSQTTLIPFQENMHRENPGTT